MSQQNPSSQPVPEAPETWVHLMQDNLWTECGLFTTSQNYVTHCVFCVTCPECLAFQPVLDEQEARDQLHLHDAAMHEKTGVAKSQYGNIWSDAPISVRIGVLLTIVFVVLALWGVVAAAIALLQSI